MTYAEKLKDPRWQKKRLEILERDNYTCQSCGAGNDNDPYSHVFHIHHIGYEPGLDPWDHPNEIMEVRCSGCHKEEHDALADSAERLFRTLRRCGCKSYDIDRLSALFNRTRPRVQELPVILKTFPNNISINLS